MEEVTPARGCVLTQHDHGKQTTHCLVPITHCNFFRALLFRLQPCTWTTLICEISSQLSRNLLNRIFSLDFHSTWKHGINFKAFFHSEWHSCSTWITHKICTGYLWYFMWFESGKSRHPNYWYSMLCLCLQVSCTEYWIWKSLCFFFVKKSYIKLVLCI